MWRQGRAPEPKFEPSELLYYRCTIRDLEYAGGDLSSLSVRLPTFSVNRGAFSEPEDVLIPPSDQPIANIELMGIAKFPVCGIPASLTPPQGKTIEFKVEHAPLEDNYAHSNVRAYKDGKLTEEKLAVTVRKDFRAEIARHAEIHRPPQI